FQPPGPSDSRSPCPLLNTLANEGLLVHMSAFVNETLQDVLNLAVDLAAFLYQLSCWIILTQMQLHDLAAHNAIEHDASLVHDDAAPGAPFAPVDTNQTKVAAVEALSSDGHVLSERDFAHARVLAEEASPPLPDRLQQLANGEPALALTIFGHLAADGSGLVLELSAFESLFGQNRLPDGFVKQAVPVTLEEATTVTAQVVAFKSEFESST
ncbi:hypothetical protein EXIGLDRAFT_618168, partial [Exidia glandulosa HHB12029]